MPIIHNNKTWASFRRGLLFTLSALLISGYGMGIAHAMIDIPNSVSPGQIEKRFEKAPTAPYSPDLQLLIPGEVEIPKEIQDQLSQQTFTLKSVAIEDAIAYKSEKLASLYKDQIGKTISLLDARKIAKEITALYHNDGYVLSQAVVPPQDVTDGILRIRVVEGVIGNVSVQGEFRSERERKAMESYTAKIKAEQPISLQTLEHYLLLINDLPGVTVTGLLRPMDSQFGAAELALTMKQNRFEGSYTVDNRGSKQIGPWQHTAAATVNSLYGYDKTQGRLFFTFPDTKELIGGELSHELPIGTMGTTLSFLASYMQTHPGEGLKVLDIEGSTKFFEAKAVHPFMRARKENLLARAVLDYRDTITDVFENANFSKDRIRSARIGGTYNLIDGYRGNNLVDMQLSQGMDVFAATDHGVDRSNAKGDSDYTKINMDLSRLQSLPYNMSVLVGATGQYAFDPLLSDEQFSLGGASYARGFNSANSMGDHGVAGKTEVRYTQTVGMRYFDYYQLYSFYDIGRTWVRDAAAGENNKTVRSSTGMGVRLNLTENFTANLEGAVPLIGPVEEANDDRHDPRFFASLTARF